MFWVEMISCLGSMIAVVIGVVKCLEHYFCMYYLGLTGFITPRESIKKCKKVDWYWYYCENNSYEIIGIGLVCFFISRGIHAFWCQPYPCVRELYNSGFYKYIIWVVVAIEVIDVLARLSGYLMKEFYIGDKTSQ